MSIWMFRLLALVLAGFCVYLAWICGKAAGTSQKVPRYFWAGVILGVPCLIWAAWHGCLMLEGSLARFRPLVWFLVPVTSILSMLYVDYLFSRALGGFFILSANELIRQGFIWDISLRPIFSLVCLTLGVAGMFLVGVPWRMRDVIELCARKRSVGRVFAAVFLIFAALLLLLPCS